jgi:hypothetical protein
MSSPSRTHGRKFVRLPTTSPIPLAYRCLSDPNAGSLTVQADQGVQVGDRAEATDGSETEETDPDVRFLHLTGADRIELVATIALAIAAILTAWSVFQGGKWSGVESFQLADANGARTASVRSGNTANEQALADITMFDNWLLALQEDFDTGFIQRDDPLKVHPEAISSFFYRHMRDEFKPAIEAWVATDPFQSIGVEESSLLPYEMDEYQLAANQEAIRLDSVADGHVEDAHESNDTGDAYIFTAVLYATVLFFAGVSGKMGDRRNRQILLTLGVLVLLGTSMFLLTLPIEF